MLGGFLYIAGGTGGEDIFYDSIERLNIVNLGSAAKVLWELIKTPKEIFSARSMSLQAALNSEEIAIFGGKDKDEDILSDVILFNTRTQQCRKVVEGDDFYGFFGGLNQAVQIAPNSIIGPVMTTNSGIDLICYVKEAAKIDVLATLPSEELPVEIMMNSFIYELGTTTIDQCVHQSQQTAQQ